MCFPDFVLSEIKQSHSLFLLTSNTMVLSLPSCATRYKGLDSISIYQLPNACSSYSEYLIGILNSFRHVSIKLNSFILLNYNLLASRCSAFCSAHVMRRYCICSCRPAISLSANLAALSETPLLGKAGSKIVNSVSLNHIRSSLIGGNAYT